MLPVWIMAGGIEEEVETAHTKPYVAGDFWGPSLDLNFRLR